MEEMLGRFESCLDGLGIAAKVAPFTAAGTGVQLAEARLARGAEDAADWVTATTSSAALRRR